MTPGPPPVLARVSLAEQALWVTPSGAPSLDVWPVRVRSRHPRASLAVLPPFPTALSDEEARRGLRAAPLLSAQHSRPCRRACEGVAVVGQEGQSTTKNLEAADGAPLGGRGSPGAREARLWRS